MVYHFPFLDPGWYFNQSHVTFLTIWIHFRTLVRWFAPRLMHMGLLDYNHSPPFYQLT